MKRLSRLIGMGALAVMAAPFAGEAAYAQSTAEFYKGKRISLIVGNNAGGAYDAYARLLARHMGKHMPGNPSFVVKNMTGAGTLIATNWLFNVAPKDGATIGNFHERMGLEPKVEPKGTQYDGREFTWLGSMAKQTSICLSWHTSGIVTVDDAKKREVIAGGSGVAGSSAIFPRVMNAVIGTKFKLITGYGGNDTDIALERGEIESRCGFGWASLKATQPEWVRDKKVNLLVQFSLKKHPELPDVPLLLDLVSKPEDRQALEILFGTQEMGRPFAAPPGIPEDRKVALRKAFDASMQDKALLQEAESMTLEIDPISGEEIQKLMVYLYDVPDPIYKRVLGFRNPVQGEQEYKPPVRTVSTELKEVGDNGSTIAFSADKDQHTAKLSGSRTKVTVAGQEAKRDALKPGMRCEVTYTGDDSEASLIACK